MKKIFYWPLTLSYAILSIVLPKNNKRIVFLSFPDCSDNAYALFLTLISRNRNDHGWQYVWLVNDLSWSSIYLKGEVQESLLSNVVVVKKNSVLGLYLFLTAKFVFFTHGTYWFARCSFRQTVVNLWHGMPLKRIGLLDGKSPKDIPFSNYVIATSSLFQQIMSRAFGMQLSNILVVGQPRNDWLFDEAFIPAKFEGYTYKKCVLWMPTYRQSTIGDIRQDSVDSEGTPFVIDKNSLAILNNLMMSNESICVIKLHPMDVLNSYKFPIYSNILIINSIEVKRRCINNYALIKAADCLLTDYSSVFIDYMLLERPIGFMISDLQSYVRGFVFDEDVTPLLPGTILRSMDDLSEFLVDVFHGRANEQPPYSLMGDHKSGASDRLLNILGIGV